MKRDSYKVDGPEEIRACLSCTKETCNNCLNGNTYDRRGAPGKPVIGINGEECVLFVTAAAAAVALNASKSAISKAIARKTKCKGYYWRFA